MFYLKPLDSELAELVLYTHKTNFDPKTHWYEYFIGAAAEKAEILGIKFPQSREYGGFVEIFRWDDGIALESLYILGNFRNRGIGTATVKSLEVESKDRLSIWAGRNTAEFYNKLGYYRDTRQGGYIMIKNKPVTGKTFTQAATQYFGAPR